MKEPLIAPYSNLSPELIIEAVESIGFHCSGSLLALNSFENRVYQIGIENSDPIIAKFYRPNRWMDEAILEEHQFAKELMELEIPVVAPIITNSKTLHHFKDYRFALFPRQGGRSLELTTLEQLEWMGRFIGRFHAVSKCRKFQYRPKIEVQNQGFSSYQFLIENHFIPSYLKQEFDSTVKSLLETITKNFQEIHSSNYIRLHGDCHPGNILWNDNGPQMVDLDDCIMGPAIQDIWMLLSGDELDVKHKLEKILKGYRQFHDFNNREISLIESLRTLRLLYYAAWLARRWDDPTFPFHFPFFNTAQYWQELLHSLKVQRDYLILPV